MSAYDIALTDLVHAAQAGEAAAMGVLLERHRPSLHAKAVGMLGYGPAAEDAVHETFVITLARIGMVREPAAISGWLHRVLHNVCLMQLRRAREVPGGNLVGVGEVVTSVPVEVMAAPSAEQELDRLALRDWVWQAIDHLSEPLRLAVLLRFFCGVRSYRHIAAACGVPVGTVRSRLSAAKRQLADRLLTEAAALDPEGRRARAERAAALRAAMIEVNDHDLGAFLDPIAQDVILEFGGRDRLCGRHHLQAGLRDDCDAGVRFHLINVVSTRGLTVAEGRFENPDTDPTHCPPAAIQIHHHPAGRTQRMVMHYTDHEGDSSQIGTVEVSDIVR